MRSSSCLKPRYPLMDNNPLVILDHIVAQDVRGLKSLDILRIPNLELVELRRDSAPAARRPCKDVL